MEKQPGLEQIRAAYQRIRPFINKTAILTSSSLNELVQASLFFKCENFQKVGAFKFRGACHAILYLSDEELSRGVVTHSSGNHAAALSLAARLKGIPARIVMPSNVPAVKVAAVKYYGGEITFCEPTQQAREQAADEIIQRTGATFIHPYNDHRIIAGQGTAALELLKDIPFRKDIFIRYNCRGRSRPSPIRINSKEK